MSPGIDFQSTKAAAYAAYPESVELRQVVHALNQAGFRDEDICLLLAPAHPLAGTMRQLSLLSQGSSPSSAGVVNWLMRFGAVVIPRVGLFVRSKDFHRALVAEPRVSSFQRNAGALFSLGVPESEVCRMAGLMSETGGVVFVNCEEIAKSQYAKEIFCTTGAKEASCLQAGAH